MMNRLFHIATAVLPFLMLFGSPQWLWIGLFAAVCIIAVLYFQGYDRHPVPPSRQLHELRNWGFILFGTVYCILALILLLGDTKVFAIWVSTYTMVWVVVYLRGRYHEKRMTRAAEQ